MRNVWWIVALVMIVSVLAISQGKTKKLAVSGHTGNVPVTQINGNNYLEVEALTQLISGSLSFHENQMTLTLTANEAATADEKVGLLRDFVRAAIEEMSTIREWHSVLATAIENQFPVAIQAAHVRGLTAQEDDSETRNIRYKTMTCRQLSS